MSTPTIDGNPGAAPDHVDRIRRRLIWALLGPFCILMSISAVAGFSAAGSGSATVATALLLVAAFALPPLLAWAGMSISREVDALERERDELKRLYGRARHDALVDGLTGLGNHRAFQDELARQLEVSKRMELPLALILIDVDDLKVVNDTLGELRVGCSFKQHCETGSGDAVHTVMQLKLATPALEPRHRRFVLRRVRIN